MKITTDKKRPLIPHPMGGTDNDGNTYGVNNKYMTVNGKPFIPVMGEFHYSRYPGNEWYDELLKMKAGGVDIVATYIFWIHHEEEKGIFDFSGDRDIHFFLSECQRAGLKVWLRIGPWAHGECRNGGFPDWLCSELGHNGLRPLREENLHPARTNDELYMKYVTNFWKHLYDEVSGMMAKDGGPVIGIQLENEYCHAGGAPTKEEGIIHMTALKKLAIDLGFDVPYYTATAWGGAIVLEGETLPVLGGYVDAPWSGSRAELPASANFLFTPFRNDENVGSDLAVGNGKSFFSKEKNPYLTAELGGGLQVTHHRRTFPFPEDIESQTLCMLGAGANLLGYYMYHGGVNPDGKLSTLQESKETGYYNDLPKKSYDFQTCIRESGKVSESYHRLKKIHSFIHSFEDELADADVFLPDTLPEGPEDTKTPRVCVRYNFEKETGFVFINNHQRKRHMSPIDGFSVELDIQGKGATRINGISLSDGETAIIPFGLKMGNTKLVGTNASLLAKIGQRYFFYATGTAPVYFDFEDEEYEDIVLLTEEQARHSYILNNALYISDRSLFAENGEVCVLTSSPCEIQKIGATDAAKTIKITEDMLTDLHEVFLHVDFGGDSAELKKDGKLLTDWFSNGEEWIVATKRYGFPNDPIVSIMPFEDGIYYDLPPKTGCGISNMYEEKEYKVKI